MGSKMHSIIKAISYRGLVAVILAALSWTFTASADRTTLITVAYAQEPLAQEQYKFITKWGSQTNNAVLYASKVTTDQSGDLYVIRGSLDLTPTVDNKLTNSAILKYDPSGLPLVEFGPYGEGYGQLISPASVAADHTGEHVYVSDRTGKILKFKSDGTFLMQWGSVGSGDGEFAQFVEGIAVDRDGNVYVADAGNARIQKFSPDGKFLAKWGSDGSGDDQLGYSYGVAISSDGSVYVADPGYRVIKKFTSNGGFLLEWEQDLIPGVGGDPIGIAVDSEGNLYVIPQSTGTVRKFTSDGEFISEFNGTTLEPAYLYAPIDVAVDRNGSVYTALQNSGVQKFDKDGNYVASISITKEGLSGFRYPRGIAVDPGGQVYVMDGEDNRIQKFTGDGEFISHWSFANPGDASASDIATDNQGNIYVLWEGVKKYTSEGAIIGSLKDGSGEEMIGVTAIAIDGSHVYVADYYRILKFTLDGSYVSQWAAGDTGQVSGRDIFVDDIAVDSEGRVYALGFFSNVVEVFSAEGAPLSKLDFSADIPLLKDHQGNTLEVHAYRIGIDSQDNGLFIGYEDGTIRKYDTNGNFIAQVSSRGSENGQVIGPTGIAFNQESGRVYVADGGNVRVQVFGKGPLQQGQSLQNDFGGWLWLLAGTAAASTVGILGYRRYIRRTASADQTTMTTNAYGIPATIGYYGHERVWHRILRGTSRALTKRSTKSQALGFEFTGIKRLSLLAKDNIARIS